MDEPTAGARRFANLDLDPPPAHPSDKILHEMSESLSLREKFPLLKQLFDEQHPNYDPKFKPNMVAKDAVVERFKRLDLD